MECAIVAGVEAGDNTVGEASKNFLTHFKVESDMVSIHQELEIM